MHTKPKIKENMYESPHSQLEPWEKNKLKSNKFTLKKLIVEREIISHLQASQQMLEMWQQGAISTARTRCRR